MVYLSITKKDAGDTTPANKQKGKKVCSCCSQSKNLTDFYLNYSPMYSTDQRTPICKECCKTYALNDDGTVNIDRLKDLLRQIDRPLYYDLIASAEKSVKKENSYISDEETKLHGYDILSKYFTLIAMRQDRAKNFSDAEKENFMHQNNNRNKEEIQKIKDEFSNPNESIYDTKKSLGATRTSKYVSDLGDFEVTDEITDLFGDGYETVVYKKMWDKYTKLRQNYTLKTSLHQEALATYVRFKVKEEIATAEGNVDEAKKWYDAAQNAADKAKLSPKQLTKADLQKGLNSFSEISQALEQAVDIVEILPRFKNQPSDSVDFNIWCYINYARRLKGLPTVEYYDVYKFYDDMRDEYLAQYGDPYGIFDNDTTVLNRENVEKFITLPNDYDEPESLDEEEPDSGGGSDD